MVKSAYPNEFPRRLESLFDICKTLLPKNWYYSHVSMDMVIYKTKNEYISFEIYENIFIIRHYVNDGCGNTIRSLLNEFTLVDPKFLENVETFLKENIL